MLSPRQISSSTSPISAKARSRPAALPYAEHLVAAVYAVGRALLWVVAALLTLAVVVAPHLRRLLRRVGCLLRIWVVPALVALGWFLWTRVVPPLLRVAIWPLGFARRHIDRIAWGMRWIAIGALLGVVAWVVDDEMRSSRLQAWLFTRLNQGMSVTV